jgi:hypothetical protein
MGDPFQAADEVIHDDKYDTEAKRPFEFHHRALTGHSTEAIGAQYAGVFW